MIQVSTVDAPALSRQNLTRKSALHPNNIGVFHQYYPLIRKLAYQLSFCDSSKNLKKELIQEGIVALLQAHEKFDYNRGVKPISYYYPCIKGAMLNYLSHEQDLSSNSVSLSTPLTFEKSDGNGDLILEDIIKDEDPKNNPDRVIKHESIKDALRKLTSKQCKVIKLHFWEGYKMSEIAELMGVSRARISSLFMSALERMKLELLTA
jgi:RNA polymerase sigma factor (sigma-70 family)